ncbi:stage II sporulation protein E [Alicyclobacillus acidocaldarius]|uniref:Stage II sporulation protein E, protein serine/threonine phosphatase n=1 Tax=Alicyclobacillus acidocaldarius subsp. acidocaldarius (strain ATCC 27009 / DSM 446 / BCRC 14685 / JCM 5260 / KCTC 1825 / NBRC 15652 / NCIMB 11725 / NRRL B-14509 / 104-IA) TaxID=521098 RepID=C8WQT0_ALIAD|nr:stage II sporulation protein E [Alicyclobacillus acidocaldarius]ACV57258.1 stage II sporulation protein E, protein serine/threonine phosphatase [Alicyclobacillus acidocaldarius subsp. acidocaldarius DSM 446]
MVRKRTRSGPKPLLAKPNRAARSPFASRWTLRAWRRALLIGALAFLLGRASIDHAVAPFALAYYAVVMALAGERRAWPAYAGILGAFTAGIEGGLELAAAIVLYKLVHRIIFRRRTADIIWAPILAGAVGFAVHLATFGTSLTLVEALLAFSQGALVTILALIFLQCIHLFLGQELTRTLRYEQVMSVVILIASVIMGFDGLAVHGVPLALLAIDWMVLVLSATGIGPAVSGAVAISMLSLLSHQASLMEVAVLGFIALICGLMRDANRFAVAATFVAGVGVLTLAYAHAYAPLLVQMTAAGAASVLYLLTPRSLFAELRSFVPGTPEHSADERTRAERVHALMTEKIHEVSQIFEELADTFSDVSGNDYLLMRDLVTQTIQKTRDSVCSLCPRQTLCWGREMLQTYNAMKHTLTNIESANGRRAAPTPELRDRCIRLDPMMSTLRYNLDLTHRDYKWLKKMMEERKLVAHQLAGVADVVRAIAKELEMEQKTLLSDREKIVSALEELGLYVDDVRIISLEPGRVEIEVVQPSESAHETSARMIAPLLSGILGEHITVAKLSVPPHGGPCTATFASARQYQVRSAAMAIAKDGRPVSGDTHTAVDLGNGRYALAISDGMGNGERAKQESKSAIDLLKRLMKAGFDEKLAVRTINSALVLRSRDEMFTTLDMAVIDLFHAKCEFLKVGSAPSYIKRGQEVIKVTGNSVPIGILEEIEVQTIEVQLLPGDVLILVSDGIYDAAPEGAETDDWVQAALAQIRSTDPQTIVDELVEMAVEASHGKVRDDMTAVAAVIERYQEQWAAIRLPNVPSLRSAERKRRMA